MVGARSGISLLNVSCYNSSTIKAGINSNSNSNRSSSSNRISNSSNRGASQIIRGSRRSPRYALIVHSSSNSSNGNSSNSSIRRHWSCVPTRRYSNCLR
ncbi:hypothetical protein ACSSS7_005918 [Eimeria intestinalis]